MGLRLQQLWPVEICVRFLDCQRRFVALRLRALDALTSAL